MKWLHAQFVVDMGQSNVVLVQTLPNIVVRVTKWVGRDRGALIRLPIVSIYTKRHSLPTVSTPKPCSAFFQRPAYFKAVIRHVLKGIASEGFLASHCVCDIC